jgi:hypothetical protein
LFAAFGVLPSKPVVVSRFGGDRFFQLLQQACLRSFILALFQSIFAAKYNFDLKSDARLGIEVFFVTKGDLWVDLVEQPFAPEIASVTKTQHRAFQAMVGAGFKQVVPLVFNSLLAVQLLDQGGPDFIAIAIVLFAPASINGVTKKQLVVDQAFVVKAGGGLPAFLAQPADALRKSQVPGIEFECVSIAGADEKFDAVQFDPCGETQVSSFRRLGEVLNTGR